MCSVTMKERLHMSRFKLPVIHSSTQKAIKFSNSTIERVEKVITGTQYSFSAFVVAATNHVLEDYSNK